MDRVVDLHGGPWHGRRVTLPPGADHIHIVGLYAKPGNFTMEEAEGATSHMPQREGTYSLVRGYTNDFEWDGWRPENE